MTAVPGGRALNVTAVWALLIGNFAMMINQVNISSVFTFGIASNASSISREFGVGVYGLGVLTSAFYVSYGVFEVPGGILATRAGPKRIVLIGAVVNAIGVLGSAVAPGFTLLSIFRFVAGFGFAFAFPSTLVLIVRYYKTGSEGAGVAFMTVSSALGAVVGYFGWAVLGGWIGWRPSLIVAGVVDLVSLAVMAGGIPRDVVVPTFRFRLQHLRMVVADKGLAALSVALFGSAATYAIVGTFMIYYLESDFGLSPGLAGIITSIFPVLQIFSAPLIGRVYDRARNMKALVLVPAGVLSFSVIIAAVDSLYAAIVSVIICGVSSGMVFTVLLAGAREVAGSNPEYESLTVAWVDTFSLLGGAVSPLYFSVMAVAAGYPTAWVVGGAVGIVLALPVLLVKNESLIRRTPRSRVLSEPRVIEPKVPAA